MQMWADVAMELIAALAVLWGVLLTTKRDGNKTRDELLHQRKMSYPQRFSEAAVQLGAREPVVRLAGVYAMASLADDWDEGRQKCVDALCAYMRIPAVPAQGSEGLEPQEAEVRRTLVRLVKEHLCEGYERDWRHMTFSFEGTVFPTECSFSKCEFRMPPQFKGAQFEGKVWFDGAIFHSIPNFDDARFKDETRFDGAQFCDDTQFVGSTFLGSTYFDGSEFRGSAYFKGSTFQGSAFFKGSTFQREAVFKEAAFGNERDYSGLFDRATFCGKVDFVDATFAAEPSFDGAKYHGELLIEGCNLVPKANGDNAPSPNGPPVGAPSQPKDFPKLGLT